MDELTILTWRIPHQAAQVVETATVPDADREAHLFRLRDALGASEMVYIPTCQRVTLVLLHPEAEPAQRATAAYETILERTIPPPESFQGRAAFHHICETATSLDSLVIGEPQILGQVKAAAQRCDETGLSGPGLRHIMSMVLRAAKTVRADTDLFKGKVSLVPLTEELIASHLASVQRPRVAVVGTGQIGERMMDLFQERAGVELHIVSRSGERATKLANERSATAHDLASFLDAPPVGLDVLALVMTTDVPILTSTKLHALARERRLLVLDLAIPRNAEATMHPNLRLVQMDDLSRMSEEAKRARADEILNARQILDDELDRIQRSYDERRLAHDFRNLTQRFQEIAEERWTNGAPEGIKTNDPRVRKWYDQTVRALLHEATQAIKNADTKEKRS